MPPGTVMGHEFGGEVVAVGAAASGWREGMRAAALPLASCGGCARCADGSVAHCPSVRYVGMGQDAGGVRELAVIPARNAPPVPAHAEPNGYDAVIECVGRPGLLEQAESAARALGRIVIAGAGETRMPLEPIGALLKELTIRFCVAYRPAEFREVIDAFATGTI